MDSQDNVDDVVLLNFVEAENHFIAGIVTEYINKKTTLLEIFLSQVNV